MKPGLELDCLIAKHVFNIDVVIKQWGKNNQYASYTDGEPAYHVFSGDMQLQNAILPYSSDIAAAWQVVEKLYKITGSGEPTILNIYGPLSDGYKVTAIWEHHDGPISDATFISESAPHAICLAALNIIGVTI